MSTGEPDTPGDNETDELLGRVLDGRFRIDELIGEGGMGRVYRGHQLSVERDVAIKLLHGELSLDEELKKRFFREAKVVSDFNHPNIVRLIDFGSESELGLLYLVMELIQGIGLDELLEHGRLRPELALRIAYQTAGALVEAHSSGVIHRDLKAENLLLVPVSDGTLQAKVVDFGIAYPQKASEKLTMTGRIYGTASYMAPEQAQGMDVDARADLFSLGVLMFEMLTGQLPIEGTNSIEVMIKQIREGPPPLSAVLPKDQFPTPVFDLVDGLLAGSPNERPSDAREVREELERIFRQQSWEPVRLDNSASGIDRFEPWLLPPVEVDEEEAVERGAEGAADSAAEGGSAGGTPPREEAETPRATPGQSAGSGTGMAPGSSSPDSAPSPSSEEANSPEGDEREDADGNGPASGASAVDPEGPTGPAPADTGSTTGGNRGLLILAVGLGLLLFVLIPVVAYVGLTYFRPDAGSPFEVVLGGGTNPDAAETKPETPEDEGEPPTDESASAEDGDSTAKANKEPNKEPKKAPKKDPVCGTIERPPIPADWRSKYKRQGADEETSLTVGKSKLNVRWSDGGGTIWLGKAAQEDGAIEIECARFAGSGSGEKCSGTLRKRGPVLTVDLEGTHACDEHFSGAWLPK